jgi:hypothetical protein
MMKKVIFMAFFCLMLPSAAFSQPRDISHEEFYAPYRAAFKLSRENSSRKVVKSEYYKDGILSSTQNDVYEIAAPDRNHWIEIDKTGDRIVKFEAITIGSVKYCRKNDREWQVISNWCSARGNGNGGASNIRSETSSVEESKIEGRKVKIYRNRYVYERENWNYLFSRGPSGWTKRAGF